MTRLIKIFFFLLIVSTANAQIKDSVQIVVAIDTMAMVQSLDSSFIATKDYPRNDGILDSVKNDDLSKPKMLSRVLIARLLRPKITLEMMGF